MTGPETSYTTQNENCNIVSLIHCLDIRQTPLFYIAFYMLFLTDIYI